MALKWRKKVLEWPPPHVFLNGPASGARRLKWVEVRSRLWGGVRGNGLESALTFYNLLLTLSVPSQPFRPVPLAYADKERPALVFDVCHRGNRFPVLFGIPAPLFMKTCHSCLDDDLRSCHSARSCPCVGNRLPWLLASSYPKCVREPYSGRNYGGSEVLWPGFVPQSGSSIRPGGYPADEELLTE